MFIVTCGDDTNLERKNHMKPEKYKLKSGETRWRFQIALPRDPLTGKRRTTRRSGFRTREQANIALTRLKSQLDREQKVSPVKTYQGIKTFKDAYDEWLVIYKTTVKPTTYFDLTKKTARLLLPEFGDKDISKIEATYIQKYLVDLSQKYKEFHAISTVLRRVFKYAYKMGYTTHDEFVKVDVPKEQRSNHKLDDDLLTEDQLKTYLNFIHNEYSFENYVYFTLLARTGMRRSEALALSWKDLKGNRLHIHQTLSTGYRGETIISETTKTKGSDRVIILDKKTLSLLNQHHLALNGKLAKQHEKNKDDLMFLSFSKGKPQAHVSSWPYGTLRRLQAKFPQLPKVDVHAFRHTYATLALKSGMSLLDLQHQLGHSSYNTTLRYYAKYTNDQKEKAAEKMSDFFDKIDL